MLPAHLYQPHRDNDPPFYEETALCGPCDLVESFDFSEASARDTKRALKIGLCRNTNDGATIITCNATSLNNIRQVSKMRLTLCCAGAIHNGDFERFLEGFDGHIVCTKLDKDKDRSILVNLLALDFVGRKRLSLYAQQQHDDRSIFMIKINSGENLKHILTKPVCLNPSSFMPFYFDKNMTICERCRTFATKKCPCGDVYYCSAECQKSDFRLHKHMCSLRL